MRLLVLLWFAGITIFLGVVPRTANVDLASGIVAAVIGLVFGAAAAVNFRRSRPAPQRFGVASVLVFALFTLYSSLLATALWGGFAIGEVARAASLGVFAFIAITRRDTVVHFFVRCLNVVALYFCVVIAGHVVLGVHPPGYQPVVPGDPFQGIHVTPATTLLAASAVTFVRSARGVNWLLVWTLFAGQLFEGHASLLLSTVAMLSGLVMVKLRDRRLSQRNRKSGRSLLGIVSAAVLILSVAHYSGLIGRLSGTEAVASRIVINEKRWEDFLAHRWFGVGAPGQTSALSREYQALAVSRFTETVRVADAGYLDVGLRYGLVGGSAYLLFWLYSAAYVAARARTWRHFAYPLLVFSFMFANVTLSVFTFPDGLFALFCVLAVSSRALPSQASAGQPRGLLPAIESTPHPPVPSSS